MKLIGEYGRAAERCYTVGLRYALGAPFRLTKAVWVQLRGQVTRRQQDERSLAVC